MNFVEDLSVWVLRTDVAEGQKLQSIGTFERMREYSPYERLTLRNEASGGAGSLRCAFLPSVDNMRMYLRKYSTISSREGKYYPSQRPGRQLWSCFTPFSSND